MMQLLCLSVSHHNAPVELRECLSLPSDQIDEAALTFPIRAGQFETLRELAILSTCNRLEVYALVDAPGGDSDGAELDGAPVLDYLQAAFGMEARQVAPYFQVYQGDQVAEHLFQVAAGLDSIAIGETQILGQVTRALEMALRTGAARHVLSSLFRSAIHAGKRVRSETEIGRHPISVASLAVTLANDALDGLARRNILVIGTGKMGEHTLRALKEAGVNEIILTNRTAQHAADLAERLGGSILPYEQINEGLAKADVVFASTAAVQPIIRQHTVSQVMRRRPDHPMLLIDLSVPRNIEPNVKGIPGVTLVDMDGLQSYVMENDHIDHVNISQAKTIIAAEVADYVKLLHIIPFIGELHRKVEEIRQREVERALRNLHNSDPRISEQFELFSRALVRKVLHEPTMHLRTETNQETLNDYVDTLARLFDLSETVASPD